MKQNTGVSLIELGRLLFLSKEQKRLFKGIVDYLMPSGILGNINFHVSVEREKQDPLLRIIQGGGG